MSLKTEKPNKKNPILSIILLIYDELMLYLSSNQKIEEVLYYISYLIIARVFYVNPFINEACGLSFSLSTCYQKTS